MIELQTLVSDLTVAEFTKLFGAISADAFLIVFVAVFAVKFIYVLLAFFSGKLADWARERREKEKQDN